LSSRLGWKVWVYFKRDKNVWQVSRSNSEGPEKKDIFNLNLRLICKSGQRNKKWEKFFLKEKNWLRREKERLPRLCVSRKTIRKGLGKMGPV